MRNYIKSILICLTIIVSFNAKAQYCTPTYVFPCFSDLTFDVIDNFWTTGGITNITNMDTDCNLMGDMYWDTEMSVSGCPGDVITTNAQCEPDPAGYIQGFAIWVDWDNSESFEADEKVYSSPDESYEVHTGTFTIPADAADGVYRMRVRSNFFTGGDVIDPCDEQTYGETEDYRVIVDNCAPTICEGDSIELDLGILPDGPLTYAWLPATDISDPFGGPVVEVWPGDTTLYVCTITGPDSTWTVEREVFVIHAANPFAGLDDSICLELGVGYPLDGSVEVGEDGLIYDWDMENFVGDGDPATFFDPDDDILDTEFKVTLPGTYEVILTTVDAAGFCPEQTDTIFILFSEPLHELDSVNPSCVGLSDGTITVTGTGTLPSVEYSIDGGATWQASNVFTDLPIGIYSITSRDMMGCMFTSEIELIDPEVVTIAVSSDTLVCQNGTATLTATAEGGTDFTFDWSIPGDDSGTQTISPIDTPTIVTVTAYNEFGCGSIEETITITLRDPISLVVSENDSICPGFASGASVTATGGDGSFSYEWTANASPMGDTGNSITTSPTVNTLYCVTVSDGCETSPVTICTQTIINPVPVPTFWSDIEAGCSPSTVNFGSPLGEGDVGVWTMDGVIYADTDSVSHEFEEVGFYDVTLVITNEFGCVTEIIEEDYMEVVDIPYPNFFINPNPVTIFNTTVKLSPSNTDPSDTYFWNIPGGSPETSTDENVTVTYPEGIPADYLVELTVTNEYGCFNTVDHYVNILSDVIIYAPNAFTPDGDQYNEGWRVYIDGIDFFDYHCQVYNRWGEIVWESFDASAMWTGTYGGDFAQEGTYVWIVQAKESTSDKRIEFSGTVSILR